MILNTFIYFQLIHKTEIAKLRLKTLSVKAGSVCEQTKKYLSDIEKYYGTPFCKLIYLNHILFDKLWINYWKFKC